MTSAVRTLFTKEEIIAGYVCEENSKSTYAPMDPVRIGLLKEALFIRWSVKKQDENKIWKQMKSVADRVCIEANLFITYRNK